MIPVQVAILVVFALSAGVACAYGVIGMAAFAALGIGLLALWMVFANPRQALKFCFVILMIGEIKFRWRDPGAALSGSIDGQVMFELAMYGVVLLISLRNLLAMPSRPLVLTRNEGMLLLYIALAIASIAWSVAPKITVVRGAQLVVLYVFSFAAVRCLGPTELLKIFGISLLFGILLLATMATVFPFANGSRVAHEITEFSWDKEARFTWFAVQPINAGAQTGAVIVFLFCCGSYLRRGWRRKLVGLPLWVYLPPLFLILLATRSRGPLLATLIAMIVVALRRHRRLRFAWWFGCIAAAALFVAVINMNSNILTQPSDLASNPNPISRFLMRGQSEADFFSMSGRGGLFQAEEGLFLDRPIVGYGFVASRGVLLNVLPWAGEAHNAFGETMLDLGIVGTIILWAPLLATLLQTLFRPAVTGDDWTQAMIAAWLTFMVVDGFSEAGFTGVVSYLPVLFFTVMFSHREVLGAAKRVGARAFDPSRRRGMNARAGNLRRSIGGIA
jgi:hypothetical protein